MIQLIKNLLIVWTRSRHKPPPLSKLFLSKTPELFLDVPVTELSLARDVEGKHPLQTEGRRKGEDRHKEMSPQKLSISCCSIFLHVQLTARPLPFIIDIVYGIPSSKI